LISVPMETNPTTSVECHTLLCKQYEVGARVLNPRSRSWGCVCRISGETHIIHRRIQMKLPWNKEYDFCIEQRNKTK